MHYLIKTKSVTVRDCDAGMDLVTSGQEEVGVCAGSESPGSPHEAYLLRCVEDPTAGAGK